MIIQQPIWTTKKLKDHQRLHLHQKCKRYRGRKRMILLSKVSSKELFQVKMFSKLLMKIVKANHPTWLETIKLCLVGRLINVETLLIIVKIKRINYNLNPVSKTQDKISMFTKLWRRQKLKNQNKVIYLQVYNLNNGKDLQVGRKSQTKHSVLMTQLK
jgi:hypothetical protein